VLIDIDDVRNDIPGVIALKGKNYVYKQQDGADCVYVEDGYPSCMIGVYLINKLKVSIDFFEENWKLNNVEFPDLEGELFREYGIHFTDEASEALTKLQTYQDTGVSWGDAYATTFGEELAG
jgi:hypothetical protein